jgi:hypothetical protein
MAELQQVTLPLLSPLMLQVPPVGGLPPPVRASMSVGTAKATAARARAAVKNFMVVLEEEV